MRFPINIFGKKSVNEDIMNGNGNKKSLENKGIENDCDNLNNNTCNINTIVNNSHINSHTLCSFLEHQGATDSNRTDTSGKSNTINATVTNSHNSNTVNNHNRNINNKNINHRVHSHACSITKPITISASSPDIMLDINSNITTKHRDSLEDSGDFNSVSRRGSVLDNDHDTLKRSSFHRSNSIHSVEDSGFSSSNCLSDEKDDISVNTSFDYEECPDSSSKCDLLKHPFSFSPISTRSRTRTFSTDSTSSDLSDSSTSEVPILSSSLPTTRICEAFSSKHRESCLDSKSNISVSEQTNLSSIGIVKRKSFRNRSRKNDAKFSKKSINNVRSVSQPIQSLDSDKDSEIDSDHNNNSADFCCKNLFSSIDAVIPFQLADLFQSNGLITLVACILYTVFLFFLVGGITLSWTVLKKFVNKSDLKDLRENMLASRRRRVIVSSSSSVSDGGS